MKELSLRDPKKYRLNDSVTIKKSSRMSANQSSLKNIAESKNNEFIKKNREEFRNQLVEIIM
jgi:hypothetical protein